jgi:alkylhydroperoxidase family enzyme
MATSDWDASTDRNAALDALVPAAYRSLRGVEAAAWADADADLAALAAAVCAATVRLPGAGPAPDLAALEPRARAAAAFAEQFSIDVSSIGDEHRGALFTQLGDDAMGFAQALYAADVLPRAWLILDRLFGAPTEPLPPVPVVPYADAFDVMLKEIAKLGALDAVLTELVRLRGARQHQCRICKSRRSRTAMLAGADDSTFAAVDFYETSDLPERTKTALRLTDAFIWQPGAVSDALIEEVRAAFTPAEAAELVLDLARNASNKVAVAFGGDEAVVTDGVELYEIDEHGELFAGMSL